MDEILNRYSSWPGIVFKAFYLSTLIGLGGLDRPCEQKGAEGNMITTKYLSKVPIWNIW